MRRCTAIPTFQRGEGAIESAVVDSLDCCLLSGVSLTVPEGAVAKGCTEVVFVVVLRDDKDRPKLSGQLVL